VPRQSASKERFVEEEKETGDGVHLAWEKKTLVRVLGERCRLVAALGWAWVVVFVFWLFLFWKEKMASMFGSWFGGEKDVKSSSSRRSKGKRSKRRSGMVPGILISLDRGEDLPAADRNGKSDPYVIFRVESQKVKSSVVKKTLNPDWQEELFLPCSEHTAFPLEVQVRDKDFVGSDFLGTASVDISALAMEDDDVSRFEVELENNGEFAGRIYFSARREEQKLSEINSKNKHKLRQWAIPSGDRKVVVELIEGRELLSSDSNGYSDPYVTFTMNKTKHKSHYKSRTLNPRWMERFEFRLQEDEQGIIAGKVYDYDMFTRDDKLGNFEIDVDELQPKIVNELWVDIIGPKGHENQPAGYIHVLVTVIDLDSLILTKEQKREMIGSVKVHVIRAKGLRSADFNGKSDPYVELSVGNARLRTPVKYKTLEPFWDELLELPVKDIFTTLDISVWDEDRNSKPDFLGALEIPLLDIKNGATNWYALKTPDFLRRAQGEIQIAMRLNYRVPAAYWTVIKRNETNLMKDQLPPFSVRRLRNAVNRLNAVFTAGLDGILLVEGIFRWKFGILPSLTGMMVWTLFCLTFRPFMIPAALLGVMIINRIRGDRKLEVAVDDKGLIITKFDDRTADKTMDRMIVNNFDDLQIDESLDDDALLEGSDIDEEPEMEDEEFEGAAPKSVGKKKKKQRKGLLKQIRMLNRLGKRVQDALDEVASMFERVENLFNWVSPLVSAIVATGLAVATVMMLILPFNVLLLLAGLFRFAIKFRKRYMSEPRSKFHVPSLELLNLLKRVPSNVERVKRARFTLSDDLRKQKSETSYKVMDDDGDAVF